VSGSSNVGGLVGQNSGTITNSYAAGSVSVSVLENNSGGLVGGTSGTISRSYYDSQTSGLNNTNRGIPKTTAEMKSREFADTLQLVASILHDDGKSVNSWVYSSGNYPTLSNTLAPATNVSPIGDGTEANPYLIQTKSQLEYLSTLAGYGKHFRGEYIKLNADITLNNTTLNGGWQNWNANGTGLTQWTPIGTFQGTFDGNGHIVSGVYINNNSDSQGLFGYVGGGVIKNLGVVASYIKGGKYVGGLVGGIMNGTITNSYATGNVSGTESVGDLVGVNYSSVIRNSYAIGNNGNGSYYNYIGTVTSITAVEMQSEDFAETLQMGAFVLSINGWEHSPGGYPTLINTLATDIFITGTGAENNPYIINTKLQLKYFSALVNTGKNYNGEYIKLGADIALNSTTANSGWQNWNTNGTGLNQWMPIGTSSSSSFRGTFDGDGHTISGVYINKTGTAATDNYQGLFGYIGSGGAIKNLGVTASYVKGNNYIGVLAGYVTGGAITNSYATGNANGSTYIGVLAGYVTGTGSAITNSYAIGNVTGTNYIGGLVGQNNTGSTINNIYVAGNVSATGTNVGGLAGANNGTINNSYYNSQTSERTDTRGTPKTTAEMQSEDFWETLQIVAVTLLANGWVYSPGGYPTLSNTLAPDIFITGAGTENNPYIINTKLQLKYLSHKVNTGENYSGKYFKLGADIALNDITANSGWQNWNASTTGLTQWTPIGRSSSSSFQGTFDGNGHIVSGIYINSTNNYQSLFGYINGGTIKNLGVTSSYVKGGNYVGVLAGYVTGGKITNSYVIGNVAGTGSSVGVLVGSGGTIHNSYTVESNGNGKYYAYNTGSVISQTTAEMQSENFWETLKIGAFVLSANNWEYSPDEYPTLSNTLAPSILEKENDQYTINTKLQLKYFSHLINTGTNNFSGENVKLGADIILNDTTANSGWQNWNASTTGLTQWTAIGTSVANSFQGTFDGNGHIISGVYINNSASNYQGLFGYINGGTIKNIGITASYIKGGTYVGGLAGFNSGSKISNSYTTGNISGTNYIGGLAGYNNSNTIENSYTTGNISGSYAGGLVGIIYSGTIKNSYASGNVSGSGNYFGSLAGSSSTTTITNSYYNSQTIPQNDNGAGTPKSPAEMQTQSTYSDWDFNEIWGIDDGNSYPFLWSQSAKFFIEASGISLATTQATFNEPVTLNATVEPSNATIRKIIWSGHEQEASIEGNQITFNKAGTITITATIVNGRGQGNNYTQSFTIEVLKATGTFVTPEAINATYTPELTLGSLVLPNYVWNDDQSTELEAGNGQQFNATYTDPSGNFTSAQGVITVNVAKANTTVPSAPTGLTAVYGQTLADVALTEDGWSWMNTATSVGNAGTQTHKAKFTPTDVNYNVATDIDVTVTVAKANPTVPSAPTGLTAVYGQTLADVTLTGGWSWLNTAASVGNVGTQTHKATFTPTNANYNVATGIDVTITVAKGDGEGTVSITTSWGYGEDPQTPSVNSPTHPNDTPVFNYTGRNNTNYSKSTTQPTDAGDYSVTASLPANENYNAFETPAFNFTISKAQGIGSVSMKSWYAGETAPQPVPQSPTNGTEAVTYRYWSADGTTYQSSSSVPPNPGSYIVEATFLEKLNYSSFKAYGAFEIFQITNVDVVWDSGCGANAKFTYNGAEQAPVPSAGGYALSVTGKGTDAGNHTAVAQFATFNKGVSLQNDVCPYTILPKPLTVTWTPEREFVYNKMTQGPTPSVSEPGVELRVSNTYSGVGEYTAENKRAPYALIISSNADNYELQNNTMDYEILPKPLKPYFSTALPAFEYNTDTLWVPSEVFTDTNALRKILEQVIDYHGFATDSEGNSDDASVLKGSPKVSIEYAASQRSMLSKRVETSQRATATIITDGVSAENYALTRPAVIMIMETIDNEAEAEKINCYRGSYCTALSKEVCVFIDGEEVASCAALKKACVIDDRCVPSMLIGECTGIGGTAVETTCEEEVPILRPAFSAGTFRVWQTASGMVNVDLGYMPSAPVALKVYDLKGKVVATEQVNTRFANVRIGVPSGVYLFRVGSRVLRAPLP